MSEKISNLDPADALTGDELIPGVQEGGNVKLTPNQIKAHAKQTGMVILIGNWNASGDVFPETGGTGSEGAVEKGNEWDITVAGTLDGDFVPAGATIRAKVNTPGQDGSNWRIFY